VDAPVADGSAEHSAEHYQGLSHWHATAGDDLSPRPSLPGDLEADVAIIGAGLTGLWTAYELQRRDPSLRIALLEKRIAGFGASGRNDGSVWVANGEQRSSTAAPSPAAPTPASTSSIPRRRRCTPAPR